MESAFFCAGIKEIGGDIEPPPPPRSPFERDPGVTEEVEAWSGMHELRKSAQLPDDPQIGFAVGETPKEEDLKELMGSGAAAGLGSEKAQGTAASPADEGMCVPHRDSTAPRDAAH